MTREQIIEKFPHLDPSLYEDRIQRKMVEQRLKEYVRQYTRTEHIVAEKVLTSSRKKYERKRLVLRIERDLALLKALS